ncbi:MAG: PaaI family thioesterase, partial [Candidatus Angelobacter sp.]
VCETSLVVQERLRQQHGFIHGGVIATMADHTAGGAARSVSGEKDVLTVEFKINYLRPAMGDRLHCTATVLRAGKTVIVAEALVFASSAGKESLVAKLTETLLVADDPNTRAGGATPRPSFEFGFSRALRCAPGYGLRIARLLGPAAFFQFFRRARPILA